MQALASAQIAPPVRSIQQRIDALKLANEKRLHIAATKKRLRSREIGIFDAMDDPKCDRMKVRDVLMSIPRLGETKVDAILLKAQIAPSKTCAGVTTHQRMRLANTLAHRHPHMPIVFRAPEHGSVLVARTMDA